MNPTPPKAVERAHDILHQSRRHTLDPLFAPRSIAVIGASEVPGSVGRAIMENLKAWDHPVYPVNPHHDSVLGITSFSSIALLPKKVDMVVIATPAATVPGIMQECAACGIPAAVIISAGFREVGKAGADLEQQVLAEARRGKVRVLGPNCLGFMIPHAGLNASFGGGIAQTGNVAFLSQSGALCAAVHDWSLRENVGFSGFVSSGSMLDIGWGDLIQYFGDDPRTKSILCYMESVGDARRFLSAAREVTLSKPVIVLKVGRTEAAAKAAASHTGALTGSDAVLDAAFHRAGVLRVDTLSELFDMAEVLGKQPRPRGPRLAIVTNAGGPGALATDMLVAGGGQLAELSPESMTGLNKILPPQWSHGNPIDVLGDASVERYASAVEIAAREPQADGICVILTPQAMTASTATAERLVAFAHLNDRPILASWMGGAAADAGRRILNAAGIPTYDYPDTAARAFALMWRYSDDLRALYETPSLGDPTEGGAPDRAHAGKILQSVREAKRTLLTEVESKQVLAAYGIPTVESQKALSEDEAVQQAEAIGFPVAVKVYSETLTHKSDVGGVQLDVRDAEGVRRAWRSIKQSVGERAGSQHFLGVTVQSMISRDGCELILGSSVDSQFGPVLLFGAGGKYVEVFKDRALGLPPLNATLARRLMEQTRVYEALKGVRGQKPVDLAKLDQLLVRFSLLVIEQRWIAEIDINPLLVSSDQMIALDARIVMHPAETWDELLPKSAIRPYPVQYVMPWKLRDGTSATIRPIRPEDEPLLVKFHQTLSERSVYYRYFGMLQYEQRIAHERLSRICFIDYDCEMALVVERRDPETQQSIILGVGRLSKLHGLSEAEFAMTISDQWQNHGLGTQLLKMLVQVGRDESLERITATILPDNYDMQRVARKAGFTIRTKIEESECRAELVL